MLQENPSSTPVLDSLKYLLVHHYRHCCSAALFISLQFSQSASFWGVVRKEIRARAIHLELLPPVKSTKIGQCANNVLKMQLVLPKIKFLNAMQIFATVIELFLL